MKKTAEENVAEFYNTAGWKMHGEVTEDAWASEDFRECAREYISKCRLRVNRHIPESGENILDMASGPIQYEEYLSFSKNYKRRYCVDLSQDALDGAKEKIGNHGVYLQGSFFDIELDQNYFDCSISLHTIYHMDKNKQEQAVRKLLYVTKPGKPVVIVYSNPRALIRIFLLPIRLVRAILKKVKVSGKNDGDLYFYRHPLDWWNQFSDEAVVQIYPWRSFSTLHQKLLIPNNGLGKKIFDVIFKLEERFPNFFVRYFEYPMIVLTKKG